MNCRLNNQFYIRRGSQLNNHCHNHIGNFLDSLFYSRLDSHKNSALGNLLCNHFHTLIRIFRCNLRYSHSRSFVHNHLNTVVHKRLRIAVCSQLYRKCHICQNNLLYSCLCIRFCKFQCSLLRKVRCNYRGNSQLNY